MAGRGRPYFVADLEPETLALPVMERFYCIIGTLTYGERAGLGRDLGVLPESIRQNWKYRRRFPGMETARRVIEWDERGRPLLSVKQEDVNLDGI